MMTKQNQQKEKEIPEQLLAAVRVGLRRQLCAVCLQLVMQPLQAWKRNLLESLVSLCLA